MERELNKPSIIFYFIRKQNYFTELCILNFRRDQINFEENWSNDKNYVQLKSQKKLHGQVQ